MANDYKKDAGKPPVLDALVPFYPALEALARLMVDSAVHHKLQGAKDPFNEWRQLPQAKMRLANAAARHLLKGPWRKDPDSGHVHAAHALFDVLACLTIHEEDNAETCCGAPDAQEWEAKGAESTVGPGLPVGTYDLIYGPAGADWREPVRCKAVMWQSGRAFACTLAFAHDGCCLSSCGRKW